MIPLFDKRGMSFSYPIPKDELARLKSLDELDLLDTKVDVDFDDLVKLAALMCETPISVVSFIDAERQILKARCGIETQSTSRDISFCTHVIVQKNLFTVPDALKDERFRNNPAVLGDPSIRFYAGMPIVNDEGVALGTVCVIDRVPRLLKPNQETALKLLSRQVSTHLRFRKERLRQRAWERAHQPVSARYLGRAAG